jgi:hypothetical protein
MNILVSNGFNLKIHYQRSQVIVGLVTIECAKPNEYNDWLMFEVQSMYPMAAWDPMEILE